jgi:hypothetical protein
MLDCDIAVIGAGIAGLTCARELAQAGDRVIVLEKSRGVGGRVATRRLHNTCADHGTRYLSPESGPFQTWMQTLVEAGVVQVWTDTIYERVAETLQPTSRRAPHYIAPAGMTAIAKPLAQGLDVRLNQRVESLTWVDSHWQLTIAPSGDAEPATLIAQRVVSAIPAPQAVMLLAGVRSQLDPQFIQQLESVQFWPSLSVIAGYAPVQATAWERQYPDVKAITFRQHPELAYLGYDSSKRTTPTQPVFVIQSSAAFADRDLDASDLQPAAAQLLTAAATIAPWLATPEWMQVHRWRYAVPKSPLAASYLMATLPGTIPMSLVCTGDWCGGSTVEAAFAAGLATAAALLSINAP